MLFNGAGEFCYYVEVKRIMPYLSVLRSFRNLQISDQFFILGLTITAILLPLDQLANLATRPPYLSLIAFLLLLQRPVVFLIQRVRGFRGGWISWPITISFALPIVSAAVASALAYDVKLAWATTALLFFCVVRGWLLAGYIKLRELAFFEQIVLVVAAVSVGFSIYQYLGDVFGLSSAWTLLKPMYSSTSTFPFPRVQSFALEPLYFAHFLFLPIGILLARYVQTKRLSRFENILLVSCLGTFILTLSRGAILGLLFVLVLFVAVARSKALILHLVKSLVFAAMLVGVLLLIAGNVKKAPATQAFTSHAVNLDDESARTRYDLWPSAVKLFEHNVVDGVGPNNARVLLHHAPATTTTDQAKHLQPINNDYLAYVSEEGLVGILLALPLLWLLLRAYRQIIRARLLHPGSSYAFALAGMAFEANAFHSLLLLRTWVVLGLLLASLRLYEARQAR